MNKDFIEVRDENNRQMFLNISHISTFKQGDGNNSPTMVIMSNGQLFKLSTDYPTFRNWLGLDKK